MSTRFVPVREYSQYSASAQALLDSCRVEYRYILRTREGQDMVRPDGTVYVFPSYMAAQRGRAMLNHRAFIIQQELST